MRIPLIGLLLLLVPFLAACDNSESDGSGDPGNDDEFETGCEESTAIAVDPRGTYLRVFDDSPTSPTMIRLTDVGVAPGDTVLLERLGEYQYMIRRDPTLVREEMIGVFSANDSLLASDQLARVPGAIDAGPDFVTRVTFRGNVSTDIPEDFKIASTTLVVPEGAVYLFVGPHDDSFRDNVDEDQDYRVCLTKS